MAVIFVSTDQQAALDQPYSHLYIDNMSFVDILSLLDLFQFHAYKIYSKRMDHFYFKPKFNTCMTNRAS